MQKKIRLLVLSLTLILSAFIIFSHVADARRRGEYARSSASAPDFIAEDVYGNKTRLSELWNRKPVLLVFLATWCGYCTRELPGLKAFADEHQERIKVVAVDSGESKRTVMNYIRRRKIDFLTLLDEDREIWRRYRVRATPTHFLIDGDGKIIARRIGFAFKKDLEAMLSMVERED
ncbi:MAG: TlpA family protein disulfide reductase [Deferribacteres bacterium]|nr:TlpA family protein disulfide reductase [Deferribacteres bacterium]